MKTVVVRRALAAVLLALTLLGALLQRTPPSEPLRPVHTVVLLLTPGLSSRLIEPKAIGPDWQAYGVLTTRSAADAGPSADPLGIAARVVATGDRTPGATGPTLGLALRRAGVRVVPLTNSDAAAAEIAGLPPPDPLLSDQPAWRVHRANLPDGYVTEAIPFAQNIKAAVAAASAPGSPPTLIIATFDDLYRDDRYAPFALPSATQAQENDSDVRLDNALLHLTQSDEPSPHLSGDVALLLVTPLASADAQARGERLGPIALWTPNDTAQTGRLLTSPSTRATPGLLAETDVAATVAELMGLPPGAQAIGAGRAARTVDGGDLRDRIAAWDAQALALRFLIYVPWALAVLLVAATFFAGRGLPRPALAVGAAAALYPVSLIGLAGLTEVGAVGFYLFAALPSLVAAGAILLAPHVLPHRRAIVGGVGLLTALVILGDLLTGGHLLGRSPLSYSVMEAARYYGIGNEAAGVLVGGALLAAILLFDGDAWAIGLFGVAICVAIAAPTLGAKAGSLIGAVVGFGVLLATQGRGANGERRRLSLPLLAAFALAILLLAALALYEGARDPESQTHVGQAIAGAQRGGVGALFIIARRKAAMDLHLLVSSPWAALLAVEAVLCALWYRTVSSDRRTPILPLLAASVALLFFNDAGVVSAALCLVFALLLTLLGHTPKSAEKSSDAAQP